MERQPVGRSEPAGAPADAAVSSPGLPFSGVTSEHSDPAMAPLSDGDQLLPVLAQGAPQVPGSCSPSQTRLSLLQGQGQGQGWVSKEQGGEGKEV